MQMRKMYQSTSRRKRAEEARKNAEECEAAGFLGLAQVNWEMAYLLDPPRRYEDDLER
jgi:hypothetical protein